MSYLKDFIPENRIVYKGRSEASAEAEVLLPDYYPTVMRIVRTEAVPFIRSKTVYGDKIAVEGNVEFRIFYQSDKGDYNSFFYKAPFSHAVDIQDVKDCSLSLSADTEYKDVRALSPQKLSLRASVGLSVTAVKSENREILAEDSERQGNVAVLSSEESFCRELRRMSKLIRHSGDISLEGKAPIDKIVRYDVRFSNAEFKPMNKKTLVKCDMRIGILYTSPDSKKLNSTEERAVISQLMDIDSGDDDVVRIITPRLADCRFDMKENPDGKVTSLEYNVEADVTLAVFKEQRFNVISDAFGVGRDIESETEKITSEKIILQKQTVFFEESVDIGQFAEVIDVAASPVLRDSRYDGEKQVFESDGEFIVSVIFSDSDGELLSSEKRVPFSLCNKAENECAGLRQELDVQLQNLTYDTAGGKINCKFECLVSGGIFISEEKEVITRLTESEIPEETDSEDSHLVLYYADKGEKLWDIAKKYRTKPEAIVKANDLEGAVIEEEKMLFITKYI